MAESAEQLRDTLHAAATGDGSAAERLVPLVYDDLRAIAARQLRQERPGHTLQPTALVNEALLRLAGGGTVPAASRLEYLVIASRVIRQVLVDHARRRTARKRGGDRNGHRVTLADLVEPAPDAGPDLAVDLEQLDEALHALATRSARQARVVELRFFGGLSVDETARALDVSPRTVKGDWRVARAWLRRALDGCAEPPA